MTQAAPTIESLQRMLNDCSCVVENETTRILAIISLAQFRLRNLPADQYKPRHLAEIADALDGAALAAEILQNNADHRAVAI